jgi:DNA endonuclease
MKLRQKSYSYSQIIDEIKKGRGVKISKGTVSYWTKGVSTPLRAGHLFSPKPTPELAYVIGVETGDGFLNVRLKHYQYRIRLKAIDRDFVEAFNQALSKILQCAPHRLWKGEKARETEVGFGSYLLHTFLSRKLDDLKPFIEHDEICVSAFIRGFSDSEGCVEVSGKVSASNTELNLLTYVQELLHRFFSIETRGPYRGKRKGTILTRRGKSYVRNADCYSIYIPKRDIALFYDEIGLSIERKKIRLQQALAHSRDVSRGVALE